MKNLKATARISALLIALFILIPPLALPTHAASNTRHDVNVIFDGKTYLGETLLYNDTTYVALRTFSNFATDCVVEWDASTSTATVTTDSLIISVKNGGEYIVANGRYLWCRHGILNIDGSIFVPLRAMATALNSEILWDGTTFTASVKSSDGDFLTGDQFYDFGALYWLSRIIHAEARGEPMLGKIAVGNVVLNRRASPGYPDTIYGVIFDMRGSPQFTPAATGAVYCIPSEDSIIAAKICLEGYSVSDDIEFFMNPRISTSSWISDNCTFVVSIGNHDFYS